MTEEETLKGFEYQDDFYPWHVTTKGKDLLLIDRITGMSTQDFFALIDDKYDLSRAPVTLALIATSIRNRFPDRSIERILRQVMDLSIEEDIEIIGADEEDEDKETPTPAGGEAGPSQTSSQTSNGSQAAASETSSAIPA